MTPSVRRVAPLRWRAGVTVAALVAACRPGPPPEVHEVEIRAMAYEPAVVESRVGDTLVWVNRDLVPHTVTAADSLWTSPPLAPGETWKRALAEGAEGAYRCLFHPTMAGRIRLSR